MTVKNNYGLGANPNKLRDEPRFVTGRCGGVVSRSINGENRMKEDTKEFVALQEVIRMSEVAEPEGLQLTLVGGGCGEVVLV
jgi:hypothetical protein